MHIEKSTNLVSRYSGGHNKIGLLQSIKKGPFLTPSYSANMNYLFTSFYNSLLF